MIPTTMTEDQRQAFTTNLRLADWLAHRFGRGLLPILDDRIQAARIGLWKAVLYYDPMKAKLTTFAVRVMIHEILKTSQRERSCSVTADGRTLPFVSVEDLSAVLAASDPSPEQQLLNREERTKLSTAVADCKVRKNVVHPAEVVALIERGYRQADVARHFGISRQRIGQIMAAVRKVGDEEEKR